MLSSNMRDRSRSPVTIRDDYDEEQDNTGRYDKNRFDSKSPNYGRDQRSSSADRDRGPRNSSKGCSSASCKIYVGNLPFQYKWQDVKDFLKNKVGMVDFVETFENDSKPRGCAVAEFRTAELAQLALETLQGCVVRGRKLRVFNKQDATGSRDFMFLFRNFENDSNNRRNVLDRVQKRDLHSNAMKRDGFPRNEETFGLSISFLESLNISGPLVNCIFVANIDFKATDTDLEKVFGMAGQVTSVELSKDQNGKSRGFAVIKYEHPVHAVQAISMFNNKKYLDREMCVRMDRDGGQPRFHPKRPSHLPDGLESIGDGLGINGKPLLDVSKFGNGGASRWGEGSFSGQEPNMSMQNTNPNPNFNQMGMMGRDNFNNMGGNNVPMNPFVGNLQGQGGFSNFGQGQMGMNPGGMSQNMISDINQALSRNNMMNNMGFGDNASGFQRGHGNGLGDMQQRGIGSIEGLRNDIGGGGFGVSSNSSSRFEGRNNGGSGSRFDGKSGPGRFNESNVIRIVNLPVDYTWQNLRDLCHDYGEVGFAEITSKGIGMVRFRSHASAVTAVDLLDQQRFDGKLLEARLL